MSNRIIFQNPLIGCFYKTPARYFLKLKNIRQIFLQYSLEGIGARAPIGGGVSKNRTAIFQYSLLFIFTCQKLETSRSLKSLFQVQF
jgi:hypothetical protein